MKRTWLVLARGIKAFGAFWWDFLVGDTPELFVAVVVIVSVVSLTSVALHWNIVSIIMLPVLVAGALGLSLAKVVMAKHRDRGSSS